MSGVPALPFVVFALGAFQVPPGSDTQPVAPAGPAPEAGVAPAEVESTPAVQRPAAAPQSIPEPAAAPTAGPEPIPEPAVNPDPTAAPVYPEPAPAQPAPDPGVGTTQQVGGGSSSAPPPSQPAYVPTDPRPGDESEGKSKREQRKEKRKGKPFLYNPLWINGGLGFSSWRGVDGERRGALGLGIGATYFFIPWVGAGMDIDNTFIFGAAEDEVSNIFSLTPTMTLIPFPRSRITPYVRGGVGPIVYNKGAGTLGRWVAGGGFIMRFNRAFVNAGVDVTGQFPDSRYEELVGGQCSVFSDSICSLNIIPRLGFGVALGKRQR